eukprot:7096050-Alexandrium_andersonii.AAC.1
MSASLVGSEMCIRDRLGASPPPSRPAACRVRGVACPAGLGTRLVSAGPVSYTHLTLPTICSV